MKLLSSHSRNNATTQSISKYSTPSKKKMMHSTQEMSLKQSFSTSAHSLTKSNTFFKNMNEYCVEDDDDHYVPPSSLKSGKSTGMLGCTSIMTSASKNKVFNNGIENYLDQKIQNVTLYVAKRKTLETQKYELRGKLTFVGEDL